MKRKRIHFTVIAIYFLASQEALWANEQAALIAKTELQNPPPTEPAIPVQQVDFEQFPFSEPKPEKKSLEKSAGAIGSELFNPTSNKPGPGLTVLPEDDNSLRLLEVKVGKYHLNDLVAAYQVKDTIFVPLGYFSQLIDLAIEIDLDKATASGFIFNEEKRFFLDAQRGEVTITGQLSQFDKSRLAIRELDDIYVDSYLMGEWLPMKLNIDLYASRLEIIPDKPLPFQMRKKREERIKQARSQRLVQDRGYPRQQIPHQSWAYPMVNQTAKLGFFRNAEDENDVFMSYTTYVTADLFNMESAWYLSGTDSEVFEEKRVTFAKRDPTANLAGPMKATEYAFGHLNETSIDLINQPLEPRPGITISNYPLTRQLQYDNHSFRGNLPPGWQVELYQNNALLDFRSEPEDGLYHFDKVPLLYGANYFRLVFYGPQGQQREETYNFNLDESLTEPGKHQYRAYLADDEDFGARTIIQYDGGITKQLSITGNFLSLPIDDSLLINSSEENHNYFNVGVRGFLTSAFLKADFIKDTKSGSVFDLEAQGRAGSFILEAGTTFFNDTFISEEFAETTDPIEQRINLKMDTAIPTSFFPRIPVSFELLKDSLESSATIERFTNRISAQKHGFSISNTFSLNQQTGLDDVAVNTTQFSRRAFGYNFRGAMSYQFKPENELSSASITADGFKLWNYHISTGISRIVQSDIDEIFFNMNRARGKFALGLNTRYSTGGVITIDLSFSMGLGREPRTGSWIPEYRPVASQGAMSVQAYLDKNQNMRKDASDEALPGVKVRVNGSGIQQEAGEDGIIYITGIEPYREIDIDIAVETLEDPLWQPSEKGKRISLRPGNVAKIDFPVMVTGEVDGTAYIQIGARNRGVGGVVVELLDMEGNVVQKTETAYDGFFLISKIPSGKYQLRVSREQTDALNLLPVKPTFVIIEPDNPIVNGMDFVLQKRNPE